MSDETKSVRLPRDVILLGWISFFADVGSEMAYPVLPLLLTGPLAASKAVLGLVEGAAQLVISGVTVWAGIRSDRGRRVPYLNVGYALPSVGRAIVALAPSWGWVLGGRLLDRVGKGLRNSPRDALLGDAVDEDQRGRAFGFHRAMDNAGAFVGVSLTVLLLWWFSATEGSGLRWTLGISAIVGVVAIALTFALREAKRHPSSGASADAAASAPLTPAYWHGLACLVVFALANSSDTFILLRAKAFGLDNWQVAAAYAGFSLVAALTSSPLGKLSDRIGRWPVIGGGVALYAATYATFALTDSFVMFATAFALYGVSTACTDGVRRALVVDHVPKGARGKGLGIMHGCVGVAALVASVAGGVLWDQYGSAATFWLGAAFAALALALISAIRPRESQRR